MTRQRPKRTLWFVVGAVALVAGAVVFQVTLNASVTAPTGITLTGWATDVEPLVGGVGTIRNDGPFDVELTAVRPVGAEAEVSLSEQGNEPGEPFAEGDRYLLPAHGGEAFVWFSLTTVDGAPTGFTVIEVDYSGPLGLQYTTTGTTVGMLAYPRELPSGVASIDASEEAFGEYLQAIRDAVADGDSDRMALVLGDSATAGEATAFMNAQAGLSDVMGYQAEQHGDATTIAYFRGDSSVDSFPAFTIRWVGHRWVVVR